MKNFLSTFLACVLAIIASSVLMTILSVLIFAGMVATLSSDEVVTVDKNSILKIEFTEDIKDQPAENPFSSINPLTMKISESLTLMDILNTIEKAATDDNIKGIFLNIDYTFSPGIATNEEIRNALLKFKESGKFIVSYADFYTQSTYYLSSVADKVFLNPAGGLDWHGMSSQIMFYKGLLDKLGIEAEVVRCGDFKSAVEPFIMNGMSPANREQMNLLLGTIWGNTVGDIAKSRGVDSTLLQKYASDLTINTQRSAVETKMVDSLLYNDEVMDILAKMSDQDEEPEFVSLSSYINYPVASGKKKLSKNKISIVYAEGEIRDGASEDGIIGGTTLAKTIAKIRKDDDVKAVVLRINSPGGSALASEVIWREVSLLQKAKPVIVSMGDYAASGGYYIAAPADVIIANRGTLTGSIGVFGLMFNAQKTLNDKLGVNVDVVKTNTSADMLTPFRKQTDAEKAYLQTSVNDVYSTFVGHVAEGRNLTTEQVLEIGGGRVWSGISADSIGLIDGYGGLHDAILLAADRAGVAEDFRVVSPESETNPFAILLKQLSKSTSAMIKGNTPKMIEEWAEIEKILNKKGVQAILPYKIEIN